MAAITDFDPATAGLRVADSPIKRKQRRPSSRAVERPRYANAIWYSYNKDQALEFEVPTRAVEETTRQLKRAARFLERTESAPGHKTEVRVQISVEPVLDENDQPVRPARSVVKFLGHKPFVLGRRITKLKAEGQPVPTGRHRTTAATREVRQTALPAVQRPVVRAVITPRTPDSRD